LFNALYIGNKLVELLYTMYHDVCDCICITESWLHSNICDGAIDPRREYLLVRKDRLGNRGGGVYFS